MCPRPSPHHLCRQVEELFKRAVPYNHPKKVYLQMAHIWQRLEKNTKAREAFKACCTKFPTSPQESSNPILYAFSRITS